MFMQMNKNERFLRRKRIFSMRFGAVCHHFEYVPKVFRKHFEACLMADFLLQVRYATQNLQPRKLLTKTLC